MLPYVIAVDTTASRDRVRKQLATELAAADFSGPGRGRAAVCGGTMGLGTGTGGRWRAWSLAGPRWAPFARPITLSPVSPWLLCVIAAFGTLGALALAAVAREEVLAAEAVGGSLSLLLALRWPSAVAMAFIPESALSITFLHRALPSTVLGVVFVLAATVLFASGSLRIRRAHLWVAVMTVTVLVAYLVPAVRLQSWVQTRQNLIWMVGGLVVLAVSMASPPSARALVRVILLTGAVAAVIALVQGDYVEGRLQGLGLNPNYLAVYVAVPIVISVGLVLRRHKPLWLLPGAACLPVLLASRSREGFLAMAAGVAFVIIQGRPRGQKMLIILAVTTIVLLFPGDLGSIASLGAGGRAAAELNYDNLIRARVALFAVHVALSNPVRGIGFGQFPAYAAVSSALGIYITTTNEYLLLAAETGLVTLAALLGLLWLAIRSPRHGDLAVVRAVIVTCAVSMLFIDSFASPALAVPFWICLGTLLAGRPVLADSAANASGPAGLTEKEMPRWPMAERRSPQANGLLSAPTGSRSSNSSTTDESG
jgi:hypothetical protein